MDTWLAANPSKRKLKDVHSQTYDGGDGKLVLASVLEQSQDVIADDDTGLAAQDFGSTHFCEVLQLIVLKQGRRGGEDFEFCKVAGGQS